MRKIFYVDRSMCGGQMLPLDFNLEEFCEILQGKVSDIEIVPATDVEGGASNLDMDLIGEEIFQEALGEYCHC